MLVASRRSDRIFRIHHEFCSVLVIFPILCISQLAYSANSTRGIDTETPFLLHSSIQEPQTSLDDTLTTRVNNSTPEYVLIEKTGKIRLTITNTGESQRVVVVNVESIPRYVEVIYLTQDFIFTIPPGATHTLSIVVKGVAEGEEFLAITLIDLVMNHTHTEIVHLSATTLRRVYIYAYGVINILTFEAARRPIKSISIRLCNTNAAHLGDNVHVVEIPKIYKACSLYYEFPFINGSFEVSLTKDVIYLTVIDTEVGLLMFVTVNLFPIPAMLLLASLFTGEIGENEAFFVFVLSIPFLFLFGLLL